MSIEYFEASSMKELYRMIDKHNDDLARQQWDGGNTKMVRSINQLNIEKDGDKFCAIVNSCVPLVRGSVGIFNTPSVWVENGKLDVNINPGGDKPYIYTM